MVEKRELVPIDSVRKFADPDYINRKIGGWSTVPEWRQFQAVCLLALDQQTEIEDLRDKVGDLRSQVERLERLLGVK